MTALILLERGHLNDVIVAPPGVDKIEESSLHLVPGERISLHDLLYAMLLRSANDTAVAGATYLSGSLPAFASLMNQKAIALGCTHTHFVTPNGLYALGHYSCASDLATIACYALKTQPLFDQIVKTQRYRVARSVKKSDELVINTSSTFLKTFPGADGVKTGYIHQAGHCFVGSATRGGWRLVAVALNSYSCREDVMSILNYGFHNFVRAPAIAKNTRVGTVQIPGGTEGIAVAPYTVVVPVSRWHAAPAFQCEFRPLINLPAAPVAEGTTVGTIVIYSHGSLQTGVPAVLERSVPRKTLGSLINDTGSPNVPIWRLASWLGIVAVSTIFGVKLNAGTITKNLSERRNWLAPRVRKMDRGRESSCRW